MAQDFYLTAAQQRANQIEAELAAAKADLAAYKANSDVESAGASVQQIANLEAERQNLTSLYQSYVASQHPPEPVPQTKEELMVKDWSRMTPEDGLALARESKYGRNLDWNDPYVRKGWAESQRRKARGE